MKPPSVGWSVAVAPPALGLGVEPCSRVGCSVENPPAVGLGVTTMKPLLVGCSVVNPSTTVGLGVTTKKPLSVGCSVGLGVTTVKPLSVGCSVAEEAPALGDGVAGGLVPATAVGATVVPSGVAVGLVPLGIAVGVSVATAGIAVGVLPAAVGADVVPLGIAVGIAVAGLVGGGVLLPASGLALGSPTASGPNGPAVGSVGVSATGDALGSSKPIVDGGKGACSFVGLKVTALCSGLALGSANPPMGLAVVAGTEVCNFRCCCCCCIVVVVVLGTR